MLSIEIKEFEIRDLINITLNYKELISIINPCLFPPHKVINQAY